jgi:hypothetical protein
MIERLGLTRTGEEAAADNAWQPQQRTAGNGSGTARWTRHFRGRHDTVRMVGFAPIALMDWYVPTAACELKYTLQTEDRRTEQAHRERVSRDWENGKPQQVRASSVSCRATRAGKPPNRQHTTREAEAEEGTKGDDKRTSVLVPGLRARHLENVVGRQRSLRDAKIRQTDELRLRGSRQSQNPARRQASRQTRQRAAWQSSGSYAQALLVGGGGARALNDRVCASTKQASPH